MKVFPVHFAVSVALSIMVLLCPCSIAQTDRAVISAANRPNVDAPQPVHPTLNLQVIEGVEVKFPGRSVFYQRVAPPT